MLTGVSTNNNSKALLQNLVNQAHEQVNVDLRKYLRELGEWDVWESLGRIKVGYPKTSYIPLPATWAGVQFCPYTAEGGMSAVQVNELTVYTDGEGPVDFAILAGTERYDFQAEAVETRGGFAATIRPVTTLMSKFPVTVLVNTNGLGIRNMNWEAPDCTSCMACLNGGGYQYGAFTVYAMEGDTPETVTKTGITTGGLAIDISLICDVWQLHCQLAPQLVGVTRWAAGIRLVQWAMFSRERQNYVTMDAALLSEQLAYYKAEYVSEFEQVAQGLRQYMGRLKDPCLNCRGRKVRVAV
jgi:hypothetical protein